MSKRLVLVVAVGVAMFHGAPCLFAQTKGEAAAERATPPEKTTSISDKTKTMEKKAGYFNIYCDAKAGKLWLEIDKWGTEFLYQSSMPAGIGSNDIGLDRGQLGGTHLVRFERSGPKVLLVQSNLLPHGIAERSVEVAGGDPEAACATFDAHRRKPRWFGNRKVTQAHRVEQLKDGGVSADA